MNATTDTDPRTITERLVAALLGAWRAIQVRHPDVAEVVLTLGAGTANPRRARWGHFAAGRWQRDQDQYAELFVAGEGLKRPVGEVFATLLHEAAHCVAYTRGIKDTSRQGRYHNQRFKALAEELGLIVEHDPTLGYSPSRLAPSTAENYRHELAELAATLHVYRHAKAPAPGPRKDTNLAKATCPCEPSRVIRVAKSVLAAAPILCLACDADFALETTATSTTTEKRQGAVSRPPVTGLPQGETMTTATELNPMDLLDQLHAAINLDQSKWQIDQLTSGEVGLIHRHYVDDYVWCETTVEIDDPAARRFTVRGLVVSCHDPARRRVTSHTSIQEAAAAAGDMLRWAYRAAGEVAAENYRQA